MGLEIGHLPSVAPLFVPADRPERFENAAASGTDAVILDLEDAVAPSAKQAARAALKTGFTDLPVYVRVNAIGTPWYEEDMAAVAAQPFAGIVLPKADAAGLRALLIASPCGEIIALIESARGLADARAMAAMHGVSRLAFGSVDFSADLGCAHIRDALLAARSELVLASRLGGKPPPVDGVTTRVHDIAEAQDDARHAMALGFGGKLCIHPKQIAAVLEGMRPDPREVAWALSVMHAGEGVLMVADAMVDDAVKLRARNILLRAGEGGGC